MNKRKVALLMADFMRVDITKNPGFDRKERLKHPDAESSMAAMEFLWITYSHVRWDFSDDVWFGGEGDARFNKGMAFKLKHGSKNHQLLGYKTMVSGTLDFKFDAIPSGVLEQPSVPGSVQNLSDLWADCVGRTSSYLNFSLMPMLGERKLPKSPWLPVFLVELNQYYTENSQRIFKGFTHSEQKMFELYLDNAFNLKPFRNQASGISDYCRQILFLEDPWLLEAAVDFGERFQQAEDAGKSLLWDPVEVRKLIYLARWYWAEKEANHPFL
ncbi:hypothetical protein FD28_GL001710 [Levilactobacillus hammesii DSM 16381]|uniref:Uncharacterized protein n=2 Tax=Levilactobacillus hammesii TaxID=267633 RepID=A0A0R1V315_9LACO|nr:hypothetical protein FD28_GL001710 [Levilactobacillus hammesii DSM 16381]